MDFTLTVNVSVEHVDGMPHAPKETVLEEITAIINQAGPARLGTDDPNGWQYEVSIWDVEEA